LWIPRLLSLVIFFFVGVAIVLTYRNLGPAAAGLPEAAQAVTLAEILLAANIGIALLYIGLIWKPRRAGDWVMTTEQGEPLEPPQWSHEPPLLAGTAPVFAKLTGCTRPTPAVPRELLDRTLSLVRVVIVAVLLFTIIDPHFFASRFPRLFFIPVPVWRRGRVAWGGRGMVDALAHAAAAGSRDRQPRHDLPNSKLSKPVQWYTLPPRFTPCASTNRRRCRGSLILMPKS
jgi:hypothetical protein